MMPSLVPEHQRLAAWDNAERERFRAPPPASTKEAAAVA
jgi:hypothetical protein